VYPIVFRYEAEPRKLHFVLPLCRPKVTLQASVPPPPPPPVSKPAKRKMSRSLSRESTMTPPPPESDDEVTFVKVSKRELSPEIVEIPELPNPVHKKPRTDPIPAHPPPTPSTVPRPLRTTTRPGPSDPSTLDPGPVYMEPYFPPTTESGRPALLEAAERRSAILQNKEKVREAQAKLNLHPITNGSRPNIANPSTSNASTNTNARMERRSRNETLLPFGIPPPSMLNWKMDVSTPDLLLHPPPASITDYELTIDGTVRPGRRVLVPVVS
jgi:hypothetical protein